MSSANATEGPTLWDGAPPEADGAHERAREAVVLDEGRVAEAGAIDQLAGSGGAFDRLFPAFRSDV